MSDFWQGMTYGALGGSIVTLSLCIRIIRFLINSHPLPAKATREQLMAEYGSDIAKYKKYSDAEVLRIVKDGNKNSVTVIESLSDDQLNRLLAQVTDADVKDELELERLARDIEFED